VLAHARALLTSTPESATAYIHAYLRDPDKILAEAADTLDFTRGPHAPQPRGGRSGVVAHVPRSTGL
jgi:S-adenosyl methyltransferase